MRGLISCRSMKAFAWIIIAISVASCCCTGGLDDDKIPVFTSIPPVALLAATPSFGAAPLDVQLDASESFDRDGTIEQYDWDMDNDGIFERVDDTATPRHLFAEDGSYTVTVRVFDNDGLTATATVIVTVSTDVIPPEAQGSSTVDGADPLLCYFDASDSFDADGEIVQYDWDFDSDGEYDLLDGGVSCSHLYGSFGTHTARVRVTDDDGLTDMADIPVTLTEEPNEPPVASLVPEPASGDPTLDVSWDASGSSDPDGTIETYDWDMDNDGSFEVTDGGATQGAAYDTPGTFTIGVRVTDDDGATDATTADIVVNELATFAWPEAVLVPTPDHGTHPLEVTWDATGSSDSDGIIEHYDWDMDNNGTYEVVDGATTTVVTYTTGGVYTVGVQVMDNDGLVASTTAVVDVNNPPVAVVAANPENGYAPGFITVFDASASADLDGLIVQYDWDMDNDGTFEITAGGVTHGATYDLEGTFTVAVRVTDDDGATDTASTSVYVGVLFPPNALLVADPDHGNAPGLGVTFDASGSNDPDGAIIQYDWDLDDDGSFEVLGGGAAQLVTYDHGSLHSVTVRVIDSDLLTDTATATVDVNNPPIADITGSPSIGPAPLTVAFDSTGSTDSDGFIAQYDYDFDDDGTFELLDGGPTPFRMFPSYGGYTVHLRVTDDDGATATASTTINVLQPPDAILDYQPTGEIPELAVIYDATASSDDDGTIESYDWDLDDDGSFEILDGAPTQTLWYSLGGSYTVHVRVTDNDGLTDSASLTLDFNGPPVAVILTTPDPPIIFWDYGDFSFDGSTSYDLDGTVVRYDWDFDGDGTWDVIDGSANQTESYFMPLQEEYYEWDCRLRVFDDDGASDSTYVTVILTWGEPS